MQEPSLTDTLVRLMPYSLIALCLWFGAALAARARRNGLKHWFAYEGGVAITVWEVRTGRKVSATSEGPVGELQFSPDGRMLIAGGRYFSEQAMVRVWDVATGQQVQTFTVDDWDVSGVAVSPDSAFVVAGASDKLYRWALAPDPQRGVFSVGRSVRSVAFVDNTTVAFGLYKDAVRLWRVRPVR